MISIGRHHFAYDENFDFAKGGMFGKFRFTTITGREATVYHIGRVLWMKLPRGKHATNPRPSADRSQKRFRSAETVPQRQNVSANTCSGETFPRCDLIGNVSLEIKPFDVKLCGTFRERPFDWTYDPPLRTRDGGSIVGGRKKRFLFAPTRRSPRARTFPPRVDLDALGALTRDQHERKVNKRPGETLLPLRTIWVGCIVHPR